MQSRSCKEPGSAGLASGVSCRTTEPEGSGKFLSGPESQIRATVWQKVTTREGKGRTIPELQPSVTSPAGQRRGDYAELVSKLRVK